MRRSGGRGERTPRLGGANGELHFPSLAFLEVHSRLGGCTVRPLSDNLVNPGVHQARRAERLGGHCGAVNRHGIDAGPDGGDSDRDTRETYADLVGQQRTLIACRGGPRRFLGPYLHAGNRQKRLPCLDQFTKFHVGPP